MYGRLKLDSGPGRYTTGAQIFSRDRMRLREESRDPTEFLGYVEENSNAADLYGDQDADAVYYNAPQRWFVALSLLLRSGCNNDPTGTLYFVYVSTLRLQH